MYKPPFNPFDWYWLADDDRVFTSARQLIVDASDADYQSWTGVGNLPTSWPRDDAGNQTNDALQEVLTPYGLSVAPETRERRSGDDKG
jgi:hypothetical protein